MTPSANDRGRSRKGKRLTTTVLDGVALRTAALPG